MARESLQASQSGASGWHETLLEDGSLPLGQLMPVSKPTQVGLKVHVHLEEVGKDVRVYYGDHDTALQRTRLCLFPTVPCIHTSGDYSRYPCFL